MSTNKIDLLLKKTILLLTILNHRNMLDTGSFSWTVCSSSYIPPGYNTTSGNIYIQGKEHY